MNSSAGVSITLERYPSALLLGRTTGGQSPADSGKKRGQPWTGHLREHFFYDKQLLSVNTIRLVDPQEQSCN